MVFTARAKLYIALACFAGLAAWARALTEWKSEELLRFLFYLLFAVLSSKMKVKLPGVMGTLSVNYVFILLSIIDLNLPQTLLVGLGGTLTQCLYGVKVRPKPIQIAFNVASVSACAFTGYRIFHSPLVRSLDPSVPMLLFWAAIAYFILNTFATSGVIALTEGKKIYAVWYESFFWTAPQYLFGGGLAGILYSCNHTIGWQYSVLVLPGIYLLYRSYHIYLSRLEEEKKHVADVADLHLRTIEALALAIEAKDDTTHAHLRRVQVYATEIAAELRLSAEEIRALETAALLHDIGKLAVPEYIINKPGRLTREEFEKVKVHPIVGAEILECVNFPYPVVPVVRSHHERWDGTGYPEGLKGEDIPAGARILAAVDCLDALATDRQYRRALPLEQALEHVVAESGKSFDPRVVEILKRRCFELDAKARLTPAGLAKLSVRAKIVRGAAPATGFDPTEAEVLPPAKETPDFITSIAAARQEFQMLHEVTRDLGSSLSVDETLSLLATRLQALVPHEAIAIYCLEGDKLIPRFVRGENSQLFSSLEIPIGEGLSGWVTENNRPIVNGNPTVESGYLDDPTKFSTLRSAISVPLEALSGVLGALTLYRSAPDAFTNDHLRILMAISSKAGLTIENALTFSRAEEKIGTDQLTGLANVHSLLVHLDKEVRWCRIARSTLAVMVLDLDGFKQVNDRFGHLLGNQVLQRTADELRRVCRGRDFISRMGGDEFVVVLPGITTEALQERSRLLTRLVAEAGRQVCGEDLVSLSLGAAMFPLDGTDAEALLSKADKRMYQVKRLHHMQYSHLKGRELNAEPAIMMQ